ncbi:transposable element Tcb2 transposase [Trichonephila clavipes]|nr:transposable element Tcb2 transposase [Trichonephila clavipes]
MPHFGKEESEDPHWSSPTVSKCHCLDFHLSFFLNLRWLLSTNSCESLMNHTREREIEGEDGEETIFITGKERRKMWRPDTYIGNAKEVKVTNEAVKDEVEKLANQLNEEAERTERPIRRISKVIYGSTCADMQVDVMGECLSSIKHIVGTTSGCFYPRSNHWEGGGRPQCDKCGCRVRNCSQHRFTTLETISNYRNSYPGFSSGRPRGTTPAEDRYIVLEARRNRRQTAGEIARHTTQATERPISRFTVARRLPGGGLFARRPVRCVPLTPAHRRKRSLWCREHPNWRDNDRGRVLFTDESRFSLRSDSHRILIWREREAAIIPRTSLKGKGSVNGSRYCNEILLPYVRLFRGAMSLQFLFMDDNAPCHRTVAAEQLLESRRLAARTLPPVTIRELRLALQDEWAAMPQQLIDTLILSMGRRCETCLAVRGDYIPY